MALMPLDMATRMRKIRLTNARQTLAGDKVTYSCADIAELERSMSL